MSTPLSNLLSLFGVKQKASSHAIATRSNQQDVWKDIWQGKNNKNTALNVSAVFACNDRISKDIASLPLRPMRRTASGSEIARDHDQYFLSKNPAQEYTKYTWQYVLNSHINLWGECFSPITRENGRPVSYGIWHPKDVEHKIINGYLIWYNTVLKIAVSDFNMIHVMWYTDDGIRGKSVLTYAQETINVALNGSKLSASLYENQMWSPGYIKYGADLTSEQADFISKNWSSYLGEGEKNTVRILDNNSEWMHFGMSLKDSEYLGTIEHTVKEIARYFGVPGSKIGVRDANVSYNSLEQENIAYAQDTILPRVISWEEELERKSLSDEDMDSVSFKFELKSRLRGDMAARAAFYQMGLNTGLLSINTALRLEDMDTIGPEGDERYINSAMIPLSKLYADEPTDEQQIKNLFNPKLNGHADKALQYK